MKYFLILIVFAALSCSSSSTPSQSQEQNSQLKATINGRAFQSVFVSFGIDGSNAFSVQAADKDNNRISLAVDNVLGPGEYQLGDEADINTGTYFGGSATESYTTDHGAQALGTLVITSLSSAEIKGTFSFRATRIDGSDVNVDVTNGEFTLLFTK
jgi:hypothetical protein